MNILDAITSFERMYHLWIHRGRLLNNISRHHLLILGDDMERDWLMFS